MDYHNILYGKDAPVLIITLHRPAALNAMSPALEQELHAALDEADADPESRAIIVTGAGRAFSAGYDMAPRPDRPQNSLDPAGLSVGEYVQLIPSADTKTLTLFLHDAYHQAWFRDARAARYGFLAVADRYEKGGYHFYLASYYHFAYLLQEDYEAAKHIMAAYPPR